MFLRFSLILCVFQFQVQKILSFCLNNLLDEVGIWNKTPDKRLMNTLYNNGEGCAYPFDNC